jgi:choice-of-anchor B domain-containing protein
VTRSVLAITSLLLAATLTTQAQDSLNVTQLSSVPGGLRSLWGYTDGSGREYALCCATANLKIVEVTNPAAPAIRATVPASGTDLKEVKTYLNYAYCINQSGPLQIVDLQYLPDSAKTVGNYNGPTYNGGHTIIIENGYAFVCKNGANPTDLRILDLAVPTAPVEVGHFTHPDAGTIFADAHDCFVRGNTCYVANLAAGWVVLDITNITSPTLQAEVTYPGNFTHNLWTDTSGQYLYTTDENVGGHIRVWDVSDVNNIVEMNDYSAAPNRIVHNCHALGDYLHVSYYTEGIRILDITLPDLPIEVGKYDTYPQGSSASFQGCWGIYPYFPSGTIIASDITNGLIVMSFNGAKAGYVMGAVQDATTLATLEGVDVTIIEKSLTKQTNAGGNYRTGAVPGTYMLVFEKFAYGPDTVVASISAGDTTIVNVTLTQLSGAELAGSVQLQGCASPIADVSITVQAAPGATDTTDAGGAYDVGFLPVGTYDVIAARFGRLPAESTVSIAAGPPQTLNLSMIPGVDDNAEFEQGWLLGVPGDDAATGIWERVDPNGTVNGATPVQPENDNTASGATAFITGQSNPGAGIGEADIDGGTTTLRSSRFSLENYIEPTLTYYRWYSNDQGANPGSDTWLVQISDDDGASWVTLETTTATNNTWLLRTFALGTLVSLTDQMRLQFVASDLGGGSVVEAGVDDILITEAGVYGDFNDDNAVTSSDIIADVNYIFKGGAAPNPLTRSDADGNCVSTAADIIALVNFVFKGGPAPAIPCRCSS